MSDELNDLLKLQGEIKVQFMGMGRTETIADDMAAEALHIFATSPVATEKHRAAYKELNP